MASLVDAEDVVGCGGFVQSEVEINYSLIEVKLYSKQGIMKYKTECAPNNGYFLIPLYDKGTFILKIEPPAGWSFEPSSVELNIDGITDKCSKGQDINFVFTGFSLNGKVLSKGRNEGPSGVEITLSNKGVERKTTTSEGGIFIFTRVMPGTYQVKASHSTWTFDKDESQVTVKDSTTEMSDSLIVSGYDVKGHVLNEGQPIKGVQFLLFFRKDVINAITGLTGCTPIPRNTLDKVQSKTDGASPLCMVDSGDDGSFVFPSVPSGEYVLVPFYQGEHITFDVVPTKLTFSVNYKSVVLKTPFQVHGFSVMGKVMTVGGQGIADVLITVNGVEKTKTSQAGVYILENISTGSYNIQAKKSDYFFDVLSVEVNPNTPKLPDIKPSGYNLCGKLVIDVFPPGTVQMSGRKVILTTEGAPISTRSASAKVDQSGAYCFKVSPGVHTIEPIVTSSETTAGLVLKPKEKQITVTNEPVKDVIFTQFRATVSGVVTCIGGLCKGVSVSLTSTTQQDQTKIVVPVTDEKTGAIFKFINVLPGKYKASVIQEMWCWGNKTIEFDITDADVMSLEFIQSGFILKCSLSHPITLNFSLENKKEVVGSFDLYKGINRFCLAEPGIYNLIPKSCHRFEQEVYRYDTSLPSVLTLTATKHLLSGVITTKEITDDTKVKIRSLKSNEVIIIGPLSYDEEDKDNPRPGSQGNNTESKKEPVVQDSYSYNFSHWGSEREQFEITPISSLLLFYPPTKTVTINDGCPGALAQIEGRRGVFLEGQITPHLAGVEITITEGAEGDLAKSPIRLLTDDKGRYRVGPLHGSIEYHLAAHKSGFIINPVANKKGDFQAFKLGEIRIQVLDERDKPLPDVLLSLSGGQFRSNNLTLEDGLMVFANLGPSKYFFRPMLKEYTFEPASQMINVEEGATVEIKVKGKRVAFSCYGSLASLSGLPEKEVAIEAVGMKSCEGMQEETRSDKDGSYRLRGLQPGCSYRVRAKIGDSNPHIERSSPSFIDVQVKDEDTMNINLITFRKLNQFDITGNVVTDQEHLHTLKVLLFKESNLDAPILTTSVGIASYFQFPPVPNDGQVYIIRLESTLSRKNYLYGLPESSVTARGIRHHVTIKFSPQSRKYEPEPSQGSLLALPLLVMLVLLGIYHNKVIPTIQQVAQVFQGVSADQVQVPYEDLHLPAKNKKKVVQRRR